MIESRSKIAEIFVISLGFLVFFGYHAWVFVLASQGCISTKQENYGINGKGRLARVVFASNIAEKEKHAILGVQNSRYVSFRHSLLTSELIVGIM